METNSQVACLLNQICAEYEAAHNGLYGLAQGATRHAFITARQENIGKLHEELQELVGDQAIALVAVKLDELSGDGANLES